MSGLPRRRFLALAGVAALGLAAGALIRRRQRLVEWLARPAVAPAPPGPLDAHAAASLLAVAQTLLEAPLTDQLYVDYFRWRAEHLPGYRALYAAFVAELDHAAERAGAASFERAPFALRRRLLATLAPQRGVQRVGEGLFRRDELRYRQQIVREIFRIFSRTDAWRRLGYDAWPGIPGGFDRLNAPPAGHA